jgi:hypothetical protein
MPNIPPVRYCVAFGLAALIAHAPVSSSIAAFHLWHVKEVFSSSDSGVQFIEMFDSFAGETAVAGFKLRSDSDGVIKEFTFPGNLVNPTPGHVLIATAGFGSLPGGVTPTFTFGQSSTPLTLPFFNPNATNITITFLGSGDSMSFTGASLPKDGIRSLEDAGAVLFPPGTPNISAGVNSPTNLLGNVGGVNLSAGDYNGNGTVDAADYVVWRKTPANFGTNAAGYAAWRSHFGNPAGTGSGTLAEGTVPEPTLIALQLGWFAPLVWRVRRARRRKSF